LILLACQLLEEEASEKMFKLATLQLSNSTHSAIKKAYRKLVLNHATPTRLSTSNAKYPRSPRQTRSTTATPCPLRPLYNPTWGTPGRVAERTTTSTISSPFLPSHSAQMVFVTQIHRPRITAVLHVHDRTSL
jgi:hypothetical protein